MFKKIGKILGIFTIVVLVCCLFCFLYISGYENEVGIEGEIINFRTPAFAVKLIKGSPDKVEKMSEVDVIVYKYENQKIFGEKGDISYYSRGVVNRVEATIYVSPNEIEQKFEYIYEYMRDVYEIKDDFYDYGLLSRDKNGFPFYVMGTNNGMYGMIVNIDMDYKNNLIHISAVDFY